MEAWLAYGLAAPLNFPLPSIPSLLSSDKMHAMWRCLIIEDDPDTGYYMVEGFRDLGYWPVLCRDGVEGLSRATGEQWDVIILDRMLPNQVDGLSLLETLRSLGNETPVLILSALAASSERVRGLNAGADDYLAKPFAFLELVARVEVLLRHTAKKERRLEIDIADLKVDLAARSAKRASLPIALQPREFRLLSYMALHAHQVLSRTVLLASVWDHDFRLPANVIDVCMSRLRQKIDDGFSRSLIHTVRGSGYMLSDKPSTLARWSRIMPDSPNVAAG